MGEDRTFQTYAFGPYRLDPGKRLLLDGAGQPVTLRGKVFDLLWHLVRHRGRPVEKAELLEALWPGTVVEENNLNQAMSALRQVLGDDVKAPTYIATLKGRGYQFIAEVVAGDDASTTDRPSATRAGRIVPVVAMLVILAVVAYLGFDRPPVPVIEGVPVLERFNDAKPQLVTDGSGSYTSPTLSPDGGMMAYISDSGGVPQVWIRNLQRGEPIRITDGPYPASSPSWSPDDDQIIYTRSGPDGAGIFSVGTLGDPGPRRIVDYGTESKYALADNSFVYARGSQVWIARNDGRDRRQILGLPSSQGFARRQPALSPDGKTLAFIHADEGPLGNVWIIPTDGGESRQLTTPETGGGYAGSPAWSHDGRTIVYTVNAGTGDENLWRIDVESGEAVALTTGPGGANNAALSRDGHRLAYTATRKLWRLTRIDPESGERASILDSRTPIVLPEVSQDGDSIAFFSVLPSGMQIFTMGIDGDNLRQLTFDEPGKNTLPTWSGDGESILYYRGRSLHRLNPIDGSDTQVFSDFHWSSRNWLDASRDRITFHNIDRPNKLQRTIVRELGESEEIELPVPIESAEFTADATEVVGFYRASGEIFICDADAVRCQGIDDDGAPLIGRRPAWSRDERHVYFLRHDESGRCCLLWRIDRNGGKRTEIVMLEDFELDNSYFGIASNGHIIYNHVDRSTEEIWMAVIDE